MSIRKIAWAVAAAFMLIASAATLVVWLNVHGDAHFPTTANSTPVAPEALERGAYLARVGNCAACHSERGGAEFAGGRGIATPFGTVYTSNLTPDPETGIGEWSADDFWRAMHNGRSRNGRFLYPAFPYPNYTLVSREDSDAIYAFLRMQPAVAHANRAHELRFPYNSQAAIAVWRALFFRPGVFEPEPDKTAEWNRGAYLVRGLGHCVACHSTRNALGATNGRIELDGGIIPVQNWYAPSLASASEAGVATWNSKEVAELLRTGTSAHGSVLGPMAEVVFRSTQYLDSADLQSIAVFLKALPQSTASATTSTPADVAALARGERIYTDHCAECHGPQGQGAAGAYPPLAGSRKVAMASATNIIRVILDGGFAPTTQGNPRPYGMPPFSQSLSNTAIAEVATYVRNAWGNQAAPVSELDVIRAR